VASAAGRVCVNGRFVYGTSSKIVATAAT
jgi:hypothetical protein